MKYDAIIVLLIIFAFLVALIIVYQLVNGCGLTLECEFTFDGLMTTFIYWGNQCNILVI